VLGIWTSLTLIWWLGLRLKPIFATDAAAQKILLASKVAKK